MVATRPDIAFAVGVVSRYMENPGKKHWEAVKGIMRCLKSIKDLCIFFGKPKAFVVVLRMQTMLVTRIVEGLLLGMCLLPQDEQSLGSPGYRSVLHSGYVFTSTG